MENKTTLSTLLQKGQKYHPLYGGGLANHLPMVLTALSQMGATSEKLLLIFNEDIVSLEEIDRNSCEVNISNIEQALGNSDSFTGYLTYFENKIANQGVEKVLRESLPVLMPGIAASAFHAVIRLAYALEANNDQEVAIALAYWCAEYQPFYLVEDVCNESLQQVLTRLSPIGANFHFSPGIIVDRMDEIGKVLKRNECLLQPVAIDLPTIKQFVLKLLSRTDNFTVLHTVTGCHAFSIICHYIDDQETALRELWKAILVSYLSTGLEYESTIGEPSYIDNIDFSKLIEKAVLSESSHVIKLVYTCFCEFQSNNDPLYYLVAKRAVDKG